ncbi:MAG: aminotransferase class V-fold PLP-dependent enzyme [Coriobacteriia bacterium]|nr:aminotransferase class V-fold PLP-dependent enzyme [Coriobacteriia bacterium]
MATAKNERAWHKMIVGVDETVPLSSGKNVKGIYFDNAATTPALTSVLGAVTEYAPLYSSVHRGAGFKSTLSMDLMEETRERVLDFVDADRRRDTVVFTKNSTEAINLLAHTFAQTAPGKIALTTRMEHIANIISWKKYMQTECVNVDAQGRLDLDHLEALLVQHRGAIGIVTVTGASNVTGLINPLDKIAKLAHAHGALVHVDMAQLAPHSPVSMHTAQASADDHGEHIDFVTFTAHKMYAPFGVGALVGPRDYLLDATPLLAGGGAVRIASEDFTQWAGTPERFEAGTPNMMGIVALRAALGELRQLTFQGAHNHERDLGAYLFAQLAKIPELTLYGPAPSEAARVSLASFNLSGMHHHDIAHILATEFGVSVRSGFFCAHYYVQALLGISNAEMKALRDGSQDVAPGMVRVSLSFYNTEEEIDQLVAALQKIAANKEHYTALCSEVSKGLCGTL